MTSLRFSLNNVFIFQLTTQGGASIGPSEFERNISFPCDSFDVKKKKIPNDVCAYD